MSKALYHNIGGLRFWSEDEIERRQSFTNTLTSCFRRELQSMNPAFRVFQVEGPCLTPEDFLGEAYQDGDAFQVNYVKAGKDFFLRGETTASTYQWAKVSGEKKPVCFWQVGKSFRTEANDGASASKLRFNEFWQLEYQIIYATTTKADYRSRLMEVLRERLWVDSRIIESDRLPPYSLSTLDVEVPYKGGWKEVASCSIRSDYDENTLVCEIAIGLDRLIETRAI